MKMYHVSHKRNQMLYAPFDHPSFEPVPPQMKMNRARSSIPYEPWPYGSSYGYPPFPLECHGCCYHEYFPGHYGFRPPYPHFPPSPQFQYHGGYPPFSGAYPAYSVPPHYSMEQPRYEYGKNAPRDYHCCGCPNHSCKREADKNVKIEEEEPEFDKKSGDSLVPYQLKNYLYPVVWIPPGYMNNAEERKHTESESKEEDKYHHGTKGDEGLKSLDMSSLESLKQGGNEKITQNQQTEDRSRFPFPIFWLPLKTDEVEKEDLKKTNAGQVSVNELPFYGSGDKISLSRTSEDNSGSEAGSKMMDKHDVPKVIPVKKMELQMEKKSSNVVETKDEANALKHPDDNREGEPSGNTTKRQPSLSKASKLPPVCLRADPLPRRKNGNGSSRSASPPANKGRSEELSNETAKSSQQHMQCTNNLDKGREMGHGKSNIKDVVEGMTGKGKNEDLNSADEDVSLSQTEGRLSSTKDIDSGEETEGKKTCVEAQLGNGELEIGEDKEVSDVKEEKSNEANNTERKKLSDAEAAVAIQSAYRAFEVRKLEPLKKLRQIADIAGQVAEVKSRIQDLDSSPDSRIDDKQRMIMGETIMSLLLKLDTIQGLHSSVRDSRKSVAKELVGLQEKLDTSRKSGASIEEASAAKPVNVLIRNSESDDVIQGEQEAAEIALDNNFPARARDIEPDSSNPSQLQPFPKADAVFGPKVPVDVLIRNSESDDVIQGEQEVAEIALDNNFPARARDIEPDSSNLSQLQPFPKADAVFGPKVVDPSVPLFADKEICKNKDEVIESRVASGLQSNNLDSKQLMEMKDEQNNEELQVPMSEVLESERSVELPFSLIPEAKISSGLEVEGFSCLVKSMDKEADTNALVELSEGVLGEGLDAQDKEIDIGKDAVPSDIVEVDAASPGDDVVDMNQVEQHGEELVKGRPVSADLKDDGKEEDGEKDENVIEEAGLEPQEIPGEAQEKEEVHTNEPAEEVHEVEQVKVRSESDKEIFGDGQLELKDFPALSQSKEGIDTDVEIVQAFETLELRPDVPFAENEILGGECKEICGVKNANGNSLGLDSSVFSSEEQEFPIEETKESQVNEKDNMADLSSDFVETPKEKALIEAEVGAERAMGDKSSLSATANQVSLKGDGKLMEENERLKEMMEKLIKAGNEQLIAISKLSGRVKDLEKKLYKKKKLKVRRC